MLTTEILEQKIYAISKLISKDKLVLILHVPDPSATPTNCFSNVLSIQKIYGGEIKYGWIFFNRFSEEYGDYIFVTHHAVWLNPSNNLVDITPFHKEVKHQPRTVDGKVLFLIDENAQPIQKENFIIPLQNRFFAVKSSSKLYEYIQDLQNKEYQYYKENFEIDF